MARKGYPHLKKHAKIRANPQLERLVLFVAIAEPLMTIPQIWQIYVAHNTGSSMLTWALYLAASIVWLVYGLKTRNVPLAISGGLWVTVEALVVLGLIVR